MGKCRPLTLLVDVKIHFYLMSRLYVELYVHQGWHSHLSILPHICSFWHLRKHTVRKIYKTVMDMDNVDMMHITRGWVRHRTPPPFWSQKMVTENNIQNPAVLGSL